MAFWIDKSGDEISINLTRGDTAMIRCMYETNDDTEYEIKPGDQITFTVRGKKAGSPIEFQKVVHGTNLVVIEPEDTANMKFGNYKFDAELKTEDNYVCTIGSYDFNVLREESY